MKIITNTQDYDNDINLINSIIDSGNDQLLANDITERVNKKLSALSLRSVLNTDIVDKPDVEYKNINIFATMSTSEFLKRKANLINRGIKFLCRDYLAQEQLIFESLTHNVIDSVGKDYATENIKYIIVKLKEYFQRLGLKPKALAMSGTIQSSNADILSSIFGLNSCDKFEDLDIIRFNLPSQFIYCIAESAGSYLIRNKAKFLGFKESGEGSCKMGWSLSEDIAIEVKQSNIIKFYVRN